MRLMKIVFGNKEFIVPEKKMYLVTDILPKGKGISVVRMKTPSKELPTPAFKQPEFSKLRLVKTFD